MNTLRLVSISAILVSSVASGQENGTKPFSGPTKDVTYRVLWLIESDDENRTPYAGPAREGLASAGYGRLVVAGSATSIVSIGQRSTITGTSRYGQMSLVTQR